MVQFVAEWCVLETGGPFLPDRKERFADRLPFGRLNVDESRAIAEKNHVKGIPALIVFRAGEELGRLPGRDAKTRERIVSFPEQMAK